MLQSLNFFHFLFIHTLHGFTEFTCQYSNNSGYSEFMSMGFEWVSKYISLMAGWHFLEAAVGRDSLIQQKMLRRMICLFLWWSNNTSLKSKWYSKKKKWPESSKLCRNGGSVMVLTLKEISYCSPPQISKPGS